MKNFFLYLKRYCLDTYTLKLSLRLATIVLIVGCITLYITYYFSTLAVSDNLRATSDLKLSETIKYIDTNLKYTSDMISDILADKNTLYINSLDYFDKKDQNLYLQTSINKISLYKNSNNMLHSVYIYLPEDEIVIQDAVYNPDDVYDLQFLPPDQEIYMCKNHTLFSHHLHSEQTDVIKIAKKTTGYSKNFYVVANIYCDYLFASINDNHIVDESVFAIFDSENNLLYSNSSQGDDLSFQDALQYDNTDNIFVSDTSDYSGWTFILASPLSGGVLSSRPIITLFTFIGVISLLAVVFMMITTVGISKPINKLYYNIADKNNIQKNQDHLEYLLKSYENLYHINNRLEKQQHLFALLYAKKIDKPEKVLADFVYPNFLVAIIEQNYSFDEIGEIANLKIAAIKSHIAQVFVDCKHDLKFETAQTSPTKIVVLLNYDENAVGGKVIFNLFSTLIDNIKADLRNNVTVGISDATNDKLLLNIAFQEAMFAIENKFVLGNSEIIYFKNIKQPLAGKTILYPTKIEYELLDYIKLSDRGRLELTMHSLVAYVYDIKDTHPTFLHHVLISLSNSIKQTAFELFKEEKVAQLYNNIDEREYFLSNNVQKMLEYINNVIMIILDEMDDIKKYKNKLLSDKIIEYIDGNYSTNLTVDSLADEFNISKSYCYKILSDEQHISPASYIATVRVAKAKEMLNDTNLAVKEISDRCGFENLQMFYRQFKKATSLSPTEYRKRQFDDKNKK